MATTTKGDFHGGFLVMNTAAVDLANHTAVLSVDTDVTVESVDGVSQEPLQANDIILGPYSVAGAGFATLEAGVVVVQNIYKSGTTLTMRTTNPSAGAVNPASIAANLLFWLVFRR